jgi:membrane carboxypeptidase/penicillin-binding protein
VVWVGFDHREPLKLSGAQAALPIWTNFMKRATAGRPAAGFIPPPGITLVPIDRLTGFRATPYCPTVIEEAFYSGEEPTLPCPLHDPETVPVETAPLPSPPRAPNTVPVEVAPPPQLPSQPPPVARPPAEGRPWWRIF